MKANSMRRSIIWFACWAKRDAHKMKKQWEQNGVLARLQSRIKRDKTLDAVMKEVQIKEEVVDRKEAY